MTGMQASGVGNIVGEEK